MREPDQKQLDDLQRDIDEVRARAKDHGTLPDEHRRTFLDPEGDGEENDYKVQTGG